MRVYSHLFVVCTLRYVFGPTMKTIYLYSTNNSAFIFLLFFFWSHMLSNSICGMWKTCCKHLAQENWHVLQIRRKTMRRKPSKTVGLPKKNWFNQKKTRKPSNCVIAFFDTFFAKKLYLCKISALFRLMAGPCTCIYLTLAFAGAGVPASSYCDGREAAGVVMMGALLL